MGEKKGPSEGPDFRAFGFGPSREISSESFGPEAVSQEFEWFLTLFLVVCGFC